MSPLPSMGLNTSLLGKISQRYQGRCQLGEMILVGIPKPTKYCHVIHQW